MKRIGHQLLVAAFIALIGFSATITTPSAEEKANPEPLDREAIELIVREYLLKHPEIMIEMQQVYESREQERLAKQRASMLEDDHDSIYGADYQIEFGNENPEITIVEFFDYNCGFCQRAMSDMQELLKANENVRFVLKEFPVLGESSIEASRVSMAFSKVMPEKHPEFHIELLGLEGVKDGNRAIDLAIEMGADEEKLRAEMENPGIFETIQSTYEIANALGISGTPSYIVGNEVVFGAVGVAEIQQHVNAQTQ